MEQKNVDNEFNYIDKKFICPRCKKYMVHKCFGVNMPQGQCWWECLNCGVSGKTCGI